MLRGFDAVLAMYHDQGLPVLKHAGFERAVNVTLGLPIVRTSVDHGTALDLAGTGRADPGSLAAAVQLAAAWPASGTDGAPRPGRPAAARASASASTSCTTRRSSTASSRRSTRAAASTWSRSARAAAR